MPKARKACAVEAQPVIGRFGVFVLHHAGNLAIFLANFSSITQVLSYYKGESGQIGG